MSRHSCLTGLLLLLTGYGVTLALTPVENPTSSPAREEPGKMRANMKTLAGALEMYALDHSFDENQMLDFAMKPHEEIIDTLVKDGYLSGRPGPAMRVRVALGFRPWTGFMIEIDPSADS